MKHGDGSCEGSSGKAESVQLGFMEDRNSVGCLDQRCIPLERIVMNERANEVRTGTSAAAAGTAVHGELEGVLLAPGEGVGAGAGDGGIAGAARARNEAVTRIYVAGKMTGEPDLNYPEFNRVAASLRQLGYTVENPAENPAPACGSWEGYMRMAIAQLVRCDEIHLLRGWSTSRGACMERWIAVELGLIISGAPA
ncbi:DUF4406 domain-containing protein [Variovorax sp. N23]|uniref:DUF4406 domain-containing protein n=1 Tax=Variovorax sp. N23 TaxID=2980555 RepID=UPI0021C6A911|nr:DUF4406 domain-containing protein [Variovorax sp. N23]MCU4119329.1 DUF4406 domain-containing protein [Variovorax sp. N23]